MNKLLKWFDFAHLPKDLQVVSAKCFELASSIDALLPDSAEKTAGLRKLLEAKDCFVRAKKEAGDEQ